jgi:hypothetical protein
MLADMQTRHTDDTLCAMHGHNAHYGGAVLRNDDECSGYRAACRVQHTT